ncbi:hypothetical protein Bbelb_146020 [Branchiostoma belcheri]|nr:hypothetical protein Bbelb_146020 [Branchiostoma belcheri]
MTWGGSVPYAGLIAGNPFHCDCDIAWLIDMAKVAEQCRLEITVRGIDACRSEIGKNALVREFRREPSLFRCKTPPDLVDVELFRLDISPCRDFWNLMFQNETHGPPCPADDSCPRDGHSNGITSSSLPPTTNSSRIEESKRNQTKMYQNFPNATNTSMLDVKNATLAAARTFGQIKVSKETSNPLDKSDQSVPVTERPPKTDKSFKEPDTQFSGWMLTTIVVVLIVATCCVVLVVYCIMVKFHAGKLAVQPNTNMHAPVNDQNSCPSVVPKPDSDDNVYEYISDDDEEEEPYAKSYVFDVPQYEMTKI